MMSEWRIFQSVIGLPLSVTDFTYLFSFERSFATLLASAHRSDKPGDVLHHVPGTLEGVALGEVVVVLRAVSERIRAERLAPLAVLETAAIPDPRLPLGDRPVGRGDFALDLLICQVGGRRTPSQQRHRQRTKIRSDCPVHIVN